MTRIMAALLVMLAGLASPAAAQNWLQTVERTPFSHIVGNPDAPVTLTEYISYTCPHCREFAMQGEEILKLGYVSKGDLRYEYRNVAANPVDLTATMMARCGAPEKFPGNHSATLISMSFCRVEPVGLSGCQSCSVFVSSVFSSRISSVLKMEFTFAGVATADIVEQAAQTMKSEMAAR